MDPLTLACAIVVTALVVMKLFRRESRSSLGSKSRARMPPTQIVLKQVHESTVRAHIVSLVPRLELTLLHLMLLLLDLRQTLVASYRFGADRRQDWAH